MTQKIINKIKLTIVDTYEELSSLATDIILKKIHALPTANLLVPTGATPLGLYQRLSQESPSLFKQVTFFNLDEYCTVTNNLVTMLAEQDPQSFRYFMKQQLFDKLHITKSYFPDETNATKEGTYDELIKKLGGIDLCINALGLDGHTFGFNFPGSSFTSQTRIVTITEQTKSIITKLTIQEIPNHAITTGIQTGMQAKEILFIVSGSRKAEILHKVIFGPVTQTVPASILRTHVNCQWIVDKQASSKL